MTEAIALDLIAELDVDDTAMVQLDVVESVVMLEVLGEVGPRGRPGIDSGYYRHEQPAPSATWNIVHNLGYRPSITVTDSAGTVVFGDVVLVDENTATVTFEAAFGGFAECS